VAFTDASHGILRADAAQAAGAQLLRTDDGGTHWRPVILPALGQGATATPFFLDRSRGWLLTSQGTTAGQRYVVYGTADGGRTWRPLGAPGPLTDVQDRLGDLVLLPGGAGWTFGSADAGGTVLFVTRDGGLTWAPQRLLLGPAGPRPTDRLDVSRPVVTSGGEGLLPVYDRGDGQGWVYATGDGGATWSDPRALPDGSGSPPTFVDASTGWTWNATTAWVTADGGRTWLRTGGLSRGWQFSAIAPVSASVAWASAAEPARTGPMGPVGWALFRTTDLGQHWTRVALPSLS
jgi:photosystem II stability/assembly factor-like uncharacterized protein